MLVVFASLVLLIFMVLCMFAGVRWHHQIRSIFVFFQFVFCFRYCLLCVQWWCWCWCCLCCGGADGVGVIVEDGVVGVVGGGVVVFLVDVDVA